VNLDAAELRVLGCLVEKQRTTPDQYPLSLNGLRLACNQATNRDPVVEYDEIVIRTALAGLSKRGYARLASGPGSRAVKYRHLFDEALELDDAEISLLTVLMLRGAQTPGELKQRSERLHRFESVPQIIETLEWLIERALVRYEHLLGEDGGGAEPAAPPEEDRLSALERRLRELEERVEALEEGR
jgi:uncharacterized protein